MSQTIDVELVLDEAAGPDAGAPEQQRLLSCAAESVLLQAMATALRRRSTLASAVMSQVASLKASGETCRLIDPVTIFCVTSAAIETGAGADLDRRLRVLSDRLRHPSPPWAPNGQFGPGSSWAWQGVGSSPALSDAFDRVRLNVRNDARAFGPRSVKPSRKAHPPAEVCEGASLIRKHAGTSWDAMQAVVRVVCPIESADVVAFTCELMPGVVFLTLKHGGPLWYAERLVHEAAHSKLYFMMLCARYVRSGDGPRFPSPWRQDPRTIKGVLHGTFVNWHVVSFFRRLIDAGVRVAAVRARLEPEFQRVRASFEVLRSSSLLTARGDALVDRIEAQILG